MQCRFPITADISTAYVTVSADHIRPGNHMEALSTGCEAE